MTSSVSVQNTSSHSITASKVIVILSKSVLIYCAQKLLTSFHFTRKNLSFPNKRKNDNLRGFSANESKPTAFAWHLVFLSRNHVESDEYWPSPYFGFVEFWVTLESIVYAVNNRR